MANKRKPYIKTQPVVSKPEKVSVYEPEVGGTAEVEKKALRCPVCHLERFLSLKVEVGMTITCPNCSRTVTLE